MPGVEQLEAVLFIQHKQNTLQLAEMIKSKFSLLLMIIDDKNVFLRHHSIREYFEYVTTSNKYNKATNANHLTKGEIRIVKNFVHKLCEEETYHRLGLEEFFHQKMSQSGTGVAVNCDDAHAQIALVCLRVVIEDFLGRDKSLKFLAPLCLPMDLKEVVPDKLSHCLRVDLVTLLIKSFRDPDAIPKFIELFPVYWSYEDECVNTVILLMRSVTLTSIADMAGPDNKEWVEMVLRDPNPKLAVLRESANYFAKLWLSRYGVLIDGVFGWLCGYANKVRKSLR